MINDTLKITGELNITLNGEVVREIKNTVVTAGKEWVASRMKDTAGSFTQKAEMSHLAVGKADTNSTAGAAAGSPGGSQLTVTALEDEPTTGTWRKALTTDGGEVTAAVASYACTFDPGEATGAIKEAGIFNGASGGDMLARTTFAVVNKGANDTMTISWTVTVS